MSTPAARQTAPPRPLGQNADNLSHPNANDHHSRSLCALLCAFLSNIYQFFSVLEFRRLVCDIYLLPLLYLPLMYAARAIEDAQAERFIDSLLEEWKTFNVLSTVLFTIVFSSFQIQAMLGDMAVRTAALLSLITAFMSLLHGATYTIYFWTIKRSYNVMVSVEDARRPTDSVRWKLWVFVAMPAVWLAWSCMFFWLAVLIFVWRLGSTVDPAPSIPPNPFAAAIGAKIVETTVFILGLCCYTTIVLELRSSGIDGIDDALGQA